MSWSAKTINVIIHLLQFGEYTSSPDAVVFGSLAESITVSRTETNCSTSSHFIVCHVTCQPCPSAKSFENHLFFFVPLVQLIVDVDDRRLFQSNTHIST